MKQLLPLLLCVCAGLTTAGAALPKVALIGDSIRLSYADVVKQRLTDRAALISPKANGGDSANVLRHLDEWVLRESPAVVHFNCGIHDTKRFLKTGKFQVSPAQYEANLRKIVTTIRARTQAVVIFANSTPILDDRAAARRKARDYELTDEAIGKYNAIARRVMAELDVPLNDLNATLRHPPAAQHSLGNLIAADGVHLTTEARKLLGEQVAKVISQHLKR